MTPRDRRHGLVASSHSWRSFEEDIHVIGIGGPIERPWPNHPEEEPRRGFTIADDGPKIPETVRDRVLEAGYTGGPESTGVGSIIVTEMVQTHDQ
ncbi:MAG: ATP-binding protein [Halanaeroarchaeum sp.]